MIINNYSRRFRFKKSSSQVIAFLVACVVSHFYAFSEAFWMPLATITVLSVPVGAILRKSLVRAVSFLGLVVITSFVFKLFPSAWLAFLLLLVLMVLAFYRDLLYLFLGFSVVLTFLYPLSTDIHLYRRVYDVTLGALIGFILFFIFPFRPDVEFRNRVIPLIQVYVDMLDYFYQHLFNESKSNKPDLNLRERMADIFVSPNYFFPNWVYQSGFSLTLQPGHRHFLLMMERLAEVFSSLSNIGRHNFREETLKLMQAPLQNYLNECRAILRALSQVLSLKKLEEPVSDLRETLIQVEKTIYEILPSFEVSNLHPDFYPLMNLLETAKDLRITLLNLGNALQTSAIRHSSS